MSQTTNSSIASDSAWLRREEIVSRFEAAWRAKGDADITVFLPTGDDTERLALLLELVKVDLEYRWGRGEEAHIESYLSRFPQLGSVDDAPLELLVEELNARGRCQRLPDSAELQRRFPKRFDQLHPSLMKLRLRAGRGGTPANSPPTGPAPVVHWPSHYAPSPNENGSAEANEPPTQGRWGEVTAAMPTSVGQYQILERIGSGGFATVYRARDQRLSRDVAIKLPHRELVGSSESRERLLREARAAARLRHPGIVPIHEVGEHDGLPFIVFEFVPGQTLADVAKLAPPTQEQAAWWVMQIAEALDYAHRNGLVHRDVKPSNILVESSSEDATHLQSSTQNPQPRVRLSDFGLALHLDADVTLTREGDLLGTPAYMSPEQARGAGHQVDARTDVYSLGVVLYELLCGRRPFEGTTASVLDQLLRAEPPAPHRSRVGIPSDLETICLKAMAKEPERRYQTAAEFAEDLHCFLRHEPIRARRVGVAERLRLWSRRNPALATTLTLALATIAAVIGVSYWRVLDERDRFRVQRETARANLYQSLIGEARAIRIARAAGYQTEAWQRLKLASEVETPERNVLQLRNEAVASLGDFVGQPPMTWPSFGPNRYAVAYAVAPKSDLVAVGLTSGDVTFRQLADGKEVGQLRHGDAGVFGIAWSTDGQRLATADDQGRVVVWQRDSEAWSKRTELQASASRRPGRVLAMTVLLTPDGEQLLVCPNGTQGISLWDAADGRKLPELSGPNFEQLSHAALSPDGSTLVAAFTSQKIDGLIVWDLKTRERRRVVPVTTQALLHVTFSDDGQWVSCATNDGAVLFQTSDWSRVLFTKGDMLYASALSPNRSWLAMPSQTGRQLRLWDFAANREVASLPHASDPLWARFSRDGEQVAAIAPGAAQTWNLNGDGTRRTLTGHAGPISQLAFHPDGRRLVSISRDNSIRVWDAESGRALSLHAATFGAADALVLSPDGRQILTSQTDEQFHVWNLDDPGQLSPARQFPHTLGSYVWNSVLSHDGQILAASGATGVQLWRAKPDSNHSRTGFALSFEPLARPTNETSSSLAISNDGARLLWVNKAGQVSAWDIVEQRPIPFPTPLTAGVPFGVEFLPNSHRFARVNSSKQIEVVNLDTPDRPEFVVANSPDVACDRLGGMFRLSADAEWFARFEPSVTIGNLADKSPLLTLPGSESATHATWSHDRRHLALGSAVGEITVWNLNEVRSRLKTLGLEW